MNFLLRLGCRLLFAFLVVAGGCDSREAALSGGGTEPSTLEGQPRERPARSAEKNGPAAGAAEPQEVTLGEPSLTAGIPGSGSLTPEQIDAWLEDPDNHASLEVRLPPGLAATSNTIFVPADNPMTRAKIELGRQLYFDRRLSADATVSCADCHHPDEGYGRHTQFGVGIREQTGNRNSPVSYNRIVSRAQFWDGRADSLEAQAVGPIANPIEMGNTHAAVVETLRGIAGYARQFGMIFPDGITIENIGKATATFERALVTGPAPFDYYEPLRAFKRAYAADIEDLEALKEDDPDAFEQYQNLLAASAAHTMSESAQRGRELFFSEQIACTACHSGANFTDEKYHNLGIGMDAESPDLGRFQVTADEKDKGAFKTPTIRNVALTAPYMHDGSLKTLEEVVEWYVKGGHPNPQLSDKIKKLKVSEQDKADLVEFMKACTGEFPVVATGRLPQ